MNRRSFLKTSVAAAVGSRFFYAPNILAAESRSSRLRIAAATRPPKAERPAGDEKKAGGINFARVKKFNGPVRKGWEI